MQLAEFFLKRLNHQDPAAVELGYRFYARTQEENLSLSRMLQELLTDCKMGEKGSMPDEKTVREERNNLGMKDSEADRVFYAQVQGTGTDSEHGFGEKRAKSQDKRTAAPEEIPNVIHRERKTEKKKKRNMFRIVHPAVLLTSLLLFAVLEIVFYYI